MPDKSMDELNELVGATFDVVDRFPVEAGKIAEFAEAIHDDDPVYRDGTGERAREHGFEDVPAPPTFTMASAFYEERQDVEGRPDVGFDPAKVLHGEQSFEFERTPVAGDVLSAEGELVDVYQRESDQRGTMTFAVWETTYRDRDDEIVVVERSTVIEVAESA